MVFAWFAVALYGGALTGVAPRSIVSFWPSERSGLAMFTPLSMSALLLNP
jgi:hypothetical protein